MTNIKVHSKNNDFANDSIWIFLSFLLWLAEPSDSAVACISQMERKWNGGKQNAHKQLVQNNLKHPEQFCKVPTKTQLLFICFAFSFYPPYHINYFVCFVFFNHFLLPVRSY